MQKQAYELVRGPKSSDPRFEDLTGMQFSRLTVVGFAGRRGPTRMWDCKCECGNTTVASAGKLKSGAHVSCGCYRSEITVKRSTTHGDTGSALHDTWCTMIQRCTNPKNPKFPDYGARGITVSSEFRDYATFKSYVDVHLGPRPPGETLDRVDNSGNYEAGNIRWLDAKGQIRNRRNTRMVGLCGTEMPLIEACEVFGLPYYVVYQRISKCGWSLADAFATPVGGKRLPPPVLSVSAGSL